uniref:KIND domain-containing protein n=1 Tax=Myripristis murdjan TaxID=586833 RepID=A0A667YTG5_9TELE
MGTFVTLAEVLEARGSPLEEDEVWCLLLAITEALLDVSSKGKPPATSCFLRTPGSVLLSASGSLAFKSCARYEDVASFTAPELQASVTDFFLVLLHQVVVYSLGMTLYWCVDYQLPQNQPVPLSTRLDSLLLSMCEDEVARRSDLLTVLETCELHHKAALLPPPERLLRQLVDDTLRESVSRRLSQKQKQKTNEKSKIKFVFDSGLRFSCFWFGLVLYVLNLFLKFGLVCVCVCVFLFMFNYYYWVGLALVCF